MKRLTIPGLLAAGLLRGLEGTAAAREGGFELAITVPLVLEAGGLGALASLLWHF